MMKHNKEAGNAVALRPQGRSLSGYREKTPGREPSGTAGERRMQAYDL